MWKSLWIPSSRRGYAGFVPAKTPWLPTWVVETGGIRDPQCAPEPFSTLALAFTYTKLNTSFFRQLCYMDPSPLKRSFCDNCQICQRKLFYFNDMNVVFEFFELRPSRTPINLILSNYLSIPSRKCPKIRYCI